MTVKPIAVELKVQDGYDVDNVIVRPPNTFDSYEPTFWADLLHRYGPLVEVWRPAEKPTGEEN